MLNAIVRFSIRRRGIVIALACLLVAQGIYTLGISTRDVFPEFAPPLAIVQTEAPGLSSEQVEVLVTRPIEAALGGALGLETMKSKSLQGISLVTLTFNATTELQLARQRANERLGAVAASLPAGVKPPALLPLTSSTGVALVIGLSAPDRSLIALHDLAQWTVKPALMGLPGVADVVVFGGEVGALQVQVDPRRLSQHGLALQDVVDAARRSTGVRGAGFIENANQRIGIRTEAGSLSPERLAAIPLPTPAGDSLRLADVATVRLAPSAPVGGASINGEPGVMLVIESQYGADPLAATHAVEQGLESLRPLLASERVTLHPAIFRPANFIKIALDHLRTALLIGGVLVIVVLFLFLYDVRTALISATAIPLSLLAAVIVLHRLGVSLNTMTLGGLAIALGEVVDDAIVDVENIFRRLRENRLLERPLAASRVVLAASLEVRAAVVYASFIVALVFLPVLTLSGVAGKLFAPLGIAYVLAVLASLGVALTVTPALSCLLLARSAPTRSEPRWVGWLKARYLHALAAVERHARLAIGSVVLLCVAALAVIPFLGASFIPELKEGHYTVHLALAPGTSLDESMRVGSRISAALTQIPGVRLVAQRAGRAEGVIDPAGVEISEFEVDLNPMSGAGQSAALSAIRDTLAGFAGVTTSVNTFLTERIDETISGFTAPVVVNVFGNDLDVLDGKAREIMQVLATVPGAVGVSLQAPPGTPQLTVRLRHARLARFGFAPLDVLDAIQVAFDGVVVAQVFDGGRVRDVSVVLDPASRRGPADVSALMLRNRQGESVALAQLADIGESSGRSRIDRSNGQRVKTVTSGVRGRNIDEFTRDLQARLRQQVAMPPGTWIVFAGEAPERARAQRDLLVNSTLAGAGILLLLWLALRSARSTLLVLLNLPFALVGGIATVVFTGATLGLGSMIGFVTVFGITLRNALMLISHFRHLVEREGMAWGRDTMLRGASERLLPILMTAVVTALGLLPLALLRGEPGNEIEGPMALVILGGLVSSTLLNLLVLPALALRYARFGHVEPALSD